jgi:hypothetical protein
MAGVVKGKKKVVSSKIEITKPTPQPVHVGETEKAMVDRRSLSIQQYHTNINTIGGKIIVYAMTLSDNLLSIKMALMQAVREMERKMRENERGG